MTETTVSIQVEPDILRHIDARRDDDGVRVGEDTIQFSIGNGVYLKLWNTEVDLNE